VGREPSAGGSPSADRRSLARPAGDGDRPSSRPPGGVGCDGGRPDEAPPWPRGTGRAASKTEFSPSAARSREGGEPPVSGQTPEPSRARGRGPVSCHRGRFSTTRPLRGGSLKGRRSSREEGAVKPSHRPAALERETRGAVRRGDGFGRHRDTAARRRSVRNGTRA